MIVDLEDYKARRIVQLEADEDAMLDAGIDGLSDAYDAGLLTPEAFRLGVRRYVYETLSRRGVRRASE